VTAGKNDLAQPQVEEQIRLIHRYEAAPRDEQEQEINHGDPSCRSATTGPNYEIDKLCQWARRDLNPGFGVRKKHRRA
jgi:hypothetical protein